MQLTFTTNKLNEEMLINPLSAKWRICMSWKHVHAFMSASETTNEWNWSDKGRRSRKERHTTGLEG